MHRSPQFLISKRSVFHRLCSVTGPLGSYFTLHFRFAVSLLLRTIEYCAWPLRGAASFLRAGMIGDLPACVMQYSLGVPFCMLFRLKSIVGLLQTYIVSIFRERIYHKETGCSFHNHSRPYLPSISLQSMHAGNT
jgi:hypothetical protein